MSWFKVHRPLLKSDLWLAEEFSRGQAWVDLVGLAAFKPSHVRIGNIRVDVVRGQFATAERFLCVRWKWSRGKVRRFLNELESDGRIVQTKSTVSTVIAITNYDSYQGDGTDDGTNAETNGEPPAVQTTDQSKEVPRRQRREKKGEAPLPPVELPPSIRTLAMEAAVLEWLQYKHERHEGYRPTGLRSFMQQLATAVATHGEAEIITRMQTAMASGWKGWNFPDRSTSPNRRSVDDPRGTLSVAAAYMEG